MTDDRLLIVNADDFGKSRAVNEGVIEAHVDGIVTSASLMVRWEDARDAAALASQHPRLSLGLHVDLGEWIHEADRGWLSVYEVVRVDDAPAVEAEVRDQLRVFRDLVGSDPSHIDSHQHVHLDEPARSFLRLVADKLDVPLRAVDGRARYEGGFYGRSRIGVPAPAAITPRALIELLTSLPPGVTELGCHPSRPSDPVDPGYGREREQELRTLCDPRVKKAISDLGIRLASFRGLAESAGGLRS